MKLEEKLRHLPDKPGVYLMKDEKGRIIYVGKAINLRNRVRSYFQSGRGHSVKVQAMVQRIADLEYILTANEIEALILECNLIKKHRPKYNISLKDDKTYPYIKVTLQEAYPRVFVTRRVQKDGARYFGPYANATAVHETLRLLRKLFPLRACRTLDAQRPCLEYHIKRCLAPCAALVDIETYGQMIKAVCLFLEGRSAPLLRDLRRQMAQAAEALNFERAARLRDQVAAIESMMQKQHVVTQGGDQDAIGLARLEMGICVQVFFIRGGKLVGRDQFLLDNAEEESDADSLGAFIKQYYSRATFIPREILLSLQVEDQELIAAWLTETAGRRVYLETPQRGGKREIVALAEENARTFLETQAAGGMTRGTRPVQGLQALAEALQLSEPPERMECYDISHIQGSETVASMVVFTGGKAHKQEYRKYKIHSTEGKPDDFLAMQEVILRRFKDETLPLPDLVIIDGGKGQLNAALAVVQDLQLPLCPLFIGLAKEWEEIFLPGHSEALRLPMDSPALDLVRQIRDEAHRFAVTYHRQLRSKRNLRSVLDHIPGIGPQRRKGLWEQFGSLAAIKAATAEELAQAPGMNGAAAQAVQEFFQQAAEKKAGGTSASIAEV